MEIMDSQKRQQILDYIAKISHSSSDKIKKLIDKEKEFQSEGNKHNEKFTPRQFYIAIDPIIKEEYERCKILELTKDTTLSVPEIAKELKISPTLALEHISVLRRKNLIGLENIEGRTPKYKAIPEAESEVK